MSDDWVQYTVRSGDEKLENILVRYGYFPAGSFPTDPMAEDHTPDIILTKTWNSDKNPGFRGKDRVYDKVVVGEKVFLPPKDVPGNFTAREYTANGTEGTLSAVVDWIKTNHNIGAACLDPSAIPLDQVTPDYLYNLQQNIPYSEAHPGGAQSGGVAVAAGDVIVYFVTLRPSANRDAAAGPSGSASSNSMVSGPAPFTITVAIDSAMTPPETQLLPVINKPGVDPVNVGNELQVNGNFRDSKASFTVGITKTGTADPYRTTFRLYTSDRTLVFEEAHTDGDWIQPGSRSWTWDGFNSADDAKAVLDTRILRGKLILQVTVEPMQGVAAVHEFFMNNKASKGEWADVKITLATRVIDVEAFVHFERITDDPVLMALVAFGMLLAAGAATGILILLEFGGSELIAWATGSKNDHKKKQVQDVMYGVTAGAVALAALITAIVELSKTRLSDEEMADAISVLRAGIAKYWTRTGTRALTIGGAQYEVHTTCTNREDNAVKFALMHPLFSGQRGVNLGMVLPGCPVIITYEPDKMAEPAHVDHMKSIGAHELGHTVLADDVDKSFSIRHKNTTGGATDQNPSATAPRYVNTPSPQDIDLMVYYQSQWPDASGTMQPEYLPGDWATRTSAVESDVLRLFRTTRVEWREDTDNAQTDAAKDVNNSSTTAPNPPAGGSPSPSPPAAA